MKRFVAISIFCSLIVVSGAAFSDETSDLYNEIEKKYGIYPLKSEELNTAGYLFYLKEFLKEADRRNLGKRFFPRDGILRHDGLRNIMVIPEGTMEKWVRSQNEGVSVMRHRRLHYSGHQSASATLDFIEQNYPREGSMEAIDLEIKTEAMKLASFDKISRIRSRYQIFFRIAGASVDHNSYAYLKVVSYDEEEKLLEGLTNLVNRLEGGTETRKEINLVFEDGHFKDDFYWDQRPTRWNSFASTPVIEEYIAKVKKEWGYVIPQERSDGLIEHLVDPSIIQMETATARLLNSTFRLNVLTENWIDVMTGWQWAGANMLKNFFELKIAEAKKRNKKIRIRKEGWKNFFQILNIEDVPEFDPKIWWENGISLDPNLIRFELKPGVVYATQLAFLYDDKLIGSEIYNFESSAQEVKDELNKKLSTAKTNNFNVYYFPVKFLQNENLFFEDGFLLLPKDVGPITLKKVTTTGAIFIRDYSYPALGEAYRDPKGLVWGDIAKKTEGIVSFMNLMNHTDATNYCASIGARLPSKAEFTRLREYMGGLSRTDGDEEGYSDERYSAQVLSSFSDDFFWSSSVNPNTSDRLDAFFAFNSLSGRISYFYRHRFNAVRCVVAH